MEWLILFIIGVIIYSSLNKKGKKASRRKDVDSDLVDFRITATTNNSRRSESKNKQSGKWVMPSEVVKIGSYEIKNGFIYVGGQLKSLDNYNTESSLVDQTLKFNTKSPDYGGDQMGYWPGYSEISPENRAAYLEWLSSERNDPETYIGYVFLYFYGLERRLLIDDHQKGQVSDSERIALLKELKRLKVIYSDNRSFNGYITNLLSHVWVINQQKNIKLPIQNLISEKKGFTSTFKYSLAFYVSKEKPIPEKLALAWVRSHPEYNLKTPARRCKKEFNLLFQLRYKQKYPNGLKVKPNKTKLQIEYYPASSSLRGYPSISLDLPDPSRLKAPVKKLMGLAESCTAELEAFSRFIGRPENSHISLTAFALLPNDLANLVPNPQFQHLKKWINSQILESDVIVPVESLLEQFGGEAPIKINKKEAEMLSNLIEKTGYGMAPDISYHQAKPDMNGKLVLFLGGHGKDFSPSHAFMQAGTILRLGAMVASIDNHIDESEVSLLKSIIENDNQLTETERRSLHAYLLWRLNTPANMAGLKSRLESINNREKTAVSHILISVALADGNIEPSEIKQLEKLYTSLGLDKSMVVSDIHSSSSQKEIPSQSKKVPVIEAETDVQTSVFSLNRELLKIHEEETHDVKSVLESIFIDDNLHEEPQIEDEESIEMVSSNDILSNLDDKHQNLYKQLITREEWSPDEIKNLCDKLQLMVDGAIEEINDWSFDHVDAPLIEDGTPIFIDLELAEEIAEL